MGLDMFIFRKTQVCYWRKFNALHNLIVRKYANGVDECQPIELSPNDIDEILKILKAVQSDHSLAPDLLPTKVGFFFGNTEYDDWYFQDVRNAIEQLSKLNTNRCYIYEASW